MAKKIKDYYLTWDAHRAGFVATARTLELLYIEHHIEIKQLYYLHPNFEPLSDKNVQQKRAFYDKKIAEPILDEQQKKDISFCRSIGKELPSLPAYQGRRLAIQSVVDYQSIYDEILQLLETDELYDNDCQWHINVSPGTPQMHVVWLMLNASGSLPKNVQLWSSQYERTAQKYTLKKVNFQPKIWLSEVFRSNYEARYGSIKIDPNETKSVAKQEAEQLLAIFSSIPNARLLILGERGTGKSTYVKNIIEKRSDLTSSKEIACGTFSHELMRSELFGHVKGAFTGAEKDKEGLLAQIGKKGILFLDEIQDLSKSLQRQLVQVFQSGVYYPVGATKPSKFEFQTLIAASNLSLEELQQQLDADFLDRISQFSIQLPPLRDCNADIALAYKKIWERIAYFDKGPKLIWNNQIEQYLTKQPLYGNYRDLEKFISYLIAFKISEKSTSLALKKAIDYYQKWCINKNSLTQSKNLYCVPNQTYRQIINQFNADLANWAISYYGNIEKAAKSLDRQVSTLYQDKRKGIKKIEDKP